MLVKADDLKRLRETVSLLKGQENQLQKWVADLKAQQANLTKSIEAQKAQLATPVTK